MRLANLTDQQLYNLSRSIQVHIKRLQTERVCYEGNFKKELEITDEIMTLCRMYDRVIDIILQRK